MKIIIGLIVLLVSATAIAGDNSGADFWMQQQDKNGDGKISEKEFLARTKQKQKDSGRKYNRQFAEKQFKQRDTDGNGYITEDELANWLGVKKQQDPDTKKEDMFAVFDADGDGKVSRKEFVRKHQEWAKEGGYDFHENLIDSKFDSIDGSGDGKLNREELGKWTKGR
ncbi:MAG: EF-hand domain-containing protein [Candidatus Pacebacteria bacterium]|nr:EF-hand domain-containing protein [Candidatus Paceibacterota bacterium]